MAELGWGFIGASIWARTRIIPAVHATDGARAVAVGSRAQERARALADAAGVPRAYGSLEELLEDPEVQVVYISSRNDLHAAQAIAAAAAGKHVLCEKPLAPSLAEAQRMQDACARAGVVFGVNHHLRGAPGIRALRAQIEAGAIGELVGARIAFLSSLPVEMRTWRLEGDGAGGGVTLDLTVHDADVLRFLLGQEIVEVGARCSSGALGAGRVEDTVVGWMRGADGVLVSFTDSFLTPHGGTSVELHGTAGSLIARDVLMPDSVGEVWLHRGDGPEPVVLPDRLPLYENVVARFTAAVRGQGTPLCTGEDGIATLAVALSALESARTGRAIPVQSVGSTDTPVSSTSRARSAM